jgi:hypothetical protein
MATENNNAATSIKQEVTNGDQNIEADTKKVSKKKWKLWQRMVLLSIIAIIITSIVVGVIYGSSPPCEARNDDGNAIWGQGTVDAMSTGICIEGYQGRVERLCTSTGWHTIIGSCIRQEQQQEQQQQQQQQLLAAGTGSYVYSNTTSAWTPYKDPLIPPTTFGSFFSAIIKFNEKVYYGLFNGVWEWFIPSPELVSPLNPPRWRLLTKQNQYIRCFCVFQNKLYVGTDVISLPNPILYTIDTNGIIDESIGEQLLGEVPNGPRAEVSSMVVWNDNLVVAGNFATANGVTVNGLALYDGTTWSSLTVERQIPLFEGSTTTKTVVGLDSYGFSGTHGFFDSSSRSGVYLAVYNGNLIVAGGEMSYITAMDRFTVSKWIKNVDGTITSVPLKRSGEEPRAICVVYSPSTPATQTLYVAFGNSNNMIQKLDVNDTVWTSTSFGGGGFVNSLIDYNGTLIAGGDFIRDNGIKHIAQFNSSANTWSSLGEILDKVNVLAII